MVSKAMLLAAAVGLSAGLALAQTDVSPTFYRLTEKSSWQQGCFAPCVCAVSEQSPITGTFWLSPSHRTEEFDVYDVSDVVWLVTAGDQRLRMTGQGAYFIRRVGEPAQQLQLNLQTDDGLVEHFDSGMVPGASQLPALDLTVSLNGGSCYDTVIHVAAEPARRATVYRLSKSSVWQGSADAGGCALGEPVSIKGTFLLSFQASNPPYDTYTITDVDWLVQTPEGARRITGSGTYQIGSQAAPTQRLQLDLRTNAGPVEHLDSGEVNAAPGFPAIDITIGINPQACFDTVIQVQAKPAGDFNLDGSVDERDFDWFQACLAGPGQANPDPACQVADLDDDGDVDQADFGPFQRCITAPGTWIDPACAQ